MIINPPLPEGKFDLIVADPPWTFKNRGKSDVNRSPEAHYRTQPLDWICEFPVPQLAATNCHLMLWITGPHIVKGSHVRVMEAWGFKPSSVAFVWVKPTLKHLQGDMFRPLVSDAFHMGLGHTTRQNAEFVLLGRKGSPKRHSKAIRQVLPEPRRQHSRKPEMFYEKVEKYAGPDARRLDLFSRTSRPGWEAWGDESGLFDGVAA